jgi:hypothetical protein
MDLVGLDRKLRRLYALSCIVVLILSCGGFDVIRAGQPPAGASSNPQEEASKPTDITAKHLTNEDVIKMVKAGLSPHIIITTIKSQSVAFDITPDKIVALKNAGVSNMIIEAVVSSASATPGKVEGLTGREVTLADGTEVILRVVKPVSSATARVEDRVEFEATEDVLAEGVMVIEKGARAWGRVIQARPKKSFGRSGKLDFTIDYVKAVDGQNLSLRSTRAVKGDDSYGKAGVVTLLVGPLGFLVKGKNVEIQSGTEYTIFINGDRRIKLESKAKN